MQSKIKEYLTLCKPRVVLLMLLTTWAGMYLASFHPIPWYLWINTTLGVALMSGASASFNHIIDQRIDAIMTRTQQRPLVTGSLRPIDAWCFAITQTVLGFLILYVGVNPLTAILTGIAAIGYAIVYSVYLKRATSQNIVIGGLSGAMPPLLGWVAVSNHLAPQAWVLVLIIFTWTPAHFWALCLHRLQEYKKAAIPMLPVTHGIAYTKLHIVLYSLLTVACSLLPFAIGMSGHLYLIGALLLNAGLVAYAFKLHYSKDYSRLALKTFHYSVLYLTGLFIVILLDHHLLIT